MESIVTCMRHKGNGIMKDKKKNFFYYVRYTVKEIYHVKPIQFVFLYVSFLLNGVLSGFTLPCTQMLFSRIEEAANGANGFLYVFEAALVLMGLRIIEQAFSFLGGFLGESYDMHSYRVLKEKLNRKANGLSAYDYENPEIINEINKAQNGIRGFVQFVNVFMDMLVNYIPYFIITIIYLKNINPMLIFILVIIFVSVAGEQVVSAKIYTEMENDSSPVQMKNNYFEACIAERDKAMETRALSAQPFFIKKLKLGLADYQRIIKTGNKNLARVALISAGIVLLEYAGILLLMAFLLVREEMTVASFAAIFTSVDTLFTAMQVAIQGRVGACVKFYAGMKNYVFFMNHTVSGGREMLSTETEKIEVEHVSFVYPSVEEKALDDISFSIYKGETIAVVGENGSGKSTLAKLLTGLFEPTEGKIYFSDKIGMPTEHVSALFQNFARYPLSFIENIRLGDIKKEMEEVQYEKVLEEANLREVRNSLENGSNEILSVEFGGTDLSGGQWQRVALARALYRNSSFFVLDEPTAALDPVSEIEFYKQMEKVLKNKTSLIITHRLGAIKFADRILVMKKGRIIGFDKHEELMKNCPYYKTFWESAVAKNGAG